MVAGGRGSWGGEGPDEGAELARMHPFGPRGCGVRMTVESGPGLLSQLNGRVAGSCKNASAPGTSLLRCLLGLQLSQDVEAAGQQPASDRHGGDVGAPAAGQLAIGVGEHRM